MAKIGILEVTLLSSLSPTILSTTKSNWSFHLISAQSIHLFLSLLPLSPSKSPSSSFLHYSNSLVNGPWHPLLLLSNLGVNPVNSLKRIDLIVTPRLKTLNDFSLLLGQVPKYISNGLQKLALLVKLIITSPRFVYISIMKIFSCFSKNTSFLLQGLCIYFPLMFLFI